MTPVKRSLGPRGGHGAAASIAAQLPVLAAASPHGRVLTDRHRRSHLPPHPDRPCRSRTHLARGVHRSPARALPRQRDQPRVTEPHQRASAAGKQQSEQIPGVCDLLCRVSAWSRQRRGQSPSCRRPPAVCRRVTAFPPRYFSPLRGKALGKAKDILVIFEQRGIDADDKSRELLESCTNLDTLNGWFRRAFKVDKASDLFAE